MLELLLRGRYKLISVLGTGGFGQTYLAENLAENLAPNPAANGGRPAPHRCVVKQFKPAKDDPQFLKVARRLFDTEVKMLERLGQHPQIPAFLDFFEENEQFYLVQEFIDGHLLSEELSPTRRLNEAQAIELLRDILETLTFVHSQQVIHRDIKPTNLIRRHADGKIVLIDFGAVKEIGTQLLNETEPKFTVAIGTQGYTPSEQLAGRPRYCSDIYALGVTIIQAITGMQPVQLPTNLETGELIWQDQAAISPGLQSILEKMVRYHFNQRYQSTQAVLEALDRLAEIRLDSTIMPSALMMPFELRHHPVDDRSLVDTPVQSVQRRRQLGKGLQIIGIAALAVTGCLAGMRQIGWLQAPELAAYDHLVRQGSIVRQGTNQSVDPRLLIVTIDENDLQTLQRGTPADRDVAQVMQTLQKYRPRAIGLDLHRDLPQEPGHAALMQQLQSPNVITIMKLGNDHNPFDIPPPSGVPPERLGFNDFPIDPDGVVRRNLLYASLANQQFTAFSLRLATKYLKSNQLVPRQSPAHPGVMQIGNVPFLPLKPNSGGYQTLDAAGYQILLDYRSPLPPARQVKFTDVLNGKLDPNWVTDKVVLIGTTAPSGKDLFYTPFSSGKGQEYLMPGVIVHAQMVSQVLSAVLDHKPLTWFLPDWAELLWIGGWAIVGGSLAWLIRHPLILVVTTASVLLMLGGSVLLIFSVHGWLPSVTPALALLLSGAIVLSWRAYRQV
jgi:CHASE2 domain-containing sensor protein